MNSINQKVAIVTGSSRGIGAAVAQRLGAEGFSVIVNYVGGEAAAQGVVQQIVQHGGKALAVQADVSDPQAVRALFDAAETSYGGIDVLVNTAGIMQPRSIADTDDETFDKHIAINLKGSFNTMREAVKRLRSGGRIINFSTSQVGLRHPTYGVYAGTKAAIEVMSSVLAKELRGRNITVNAVAPGPTATELFLKNPQEVIDRLTKMPPLERLGQPEDMVGMVSFLAQGDGSWVNGQVLRINGGII
ncbi:SDR family oxidoreductase [Janthinobacterium agaricidamnosum]|uniref:Short chain dehydrogenase family protein n=1 Tax=Janthinobacterium agaricidamnosum NBRC 102515 = DSM 9628 TaxID=1349767 RepID=W0V030_9BURK|nr:SDR family oxidoreductase [Janthinobacterium agaricidamnosum]CDG80688.1 short chain dehydrogenase family protein [Janthinobacterium agaricidamnosum NBRC 102515 = DSM 9628]